MLHARLTPSELYTRVDLEARIEGSSGDELTGICFDAIVRDLGRAGLAAQRDNRSDVIGGLSRAASVLGSLQRAVNPDAPMGDVLIDFYSSISLRLREAMKTRSQREISALQTDVAEVGAALFPKQPSSHAGASL